MTEEEVYSFVCGFMACLFLVAYASFTKSTRKGSVPKARNQLPPPNK